jgi:hypothetical protein
MLDDHSPDQEDKVRRLERHGGVRLPAVLVQANPYLYEREPDHDLPCLVLISFDDDLPGGVEFLRRLAADAFALKGVRAHSPEACEVQDVLKASDERAVRNRRCRLPAAFADGRVVYAADLWLHRPYLRRGYLSGERVLKVIAEPGANGAVEHLPHDARVRVPAGTPADYDVPEARDERPAPRRDRDDRRSDDRDDRRRDDRDDRPRYRDERDDRSASRRRRRLDDPEEGGGGRTALIVTLIVGGVLLLALLAVVGVWWALRGGPSASTVTLSNPRRSIGFGLQQTYQIDYTVATHKTVPAGQVFAVFTARNGQTTEQQVFGPMFGNGTLTLTLVGFAGGPWDVHLEVQPIGQPNQARTRISNTVTLP